MKPLNGILILDFSQFLAGPSAALRLADLGARVIKIERKGIGDLCRKLTLNNVNLDNDSALFHTINRNKESFEVNLKEPEDLEKVKKLIAKADIMIESFRPGVMENLGIDYLSVQKINPKIVYGSITGYGKEGPWRDKPGQDLLVQSLSGLPWLNGDADQPPVPFGLAVVDMMTGAHLVQGILSLLVRRGRTSFGGLIEVSLLESVLDFQFEVLTTHLNDGGQHPNRSTVNNAHAYLGAPYGIYETLDGYIAISMGSVIELTNLIKCEELLEYTDPKLWFSKRDEIKNILKIHLKTRPTIEWISALESGGYWCADVFTWEKLLNHEGFQVLDMIQEINRPSGSSYKTTRCPIRINGKTLKSPKWGPSLGENTKEIESELIFARES